MENLTSGKMDKSSYFGSVRSEISPLLPERICTILEIGCGNGATMAWLGSIRDVEFSAGVELCEEAAKEARNVFDEIETGSVDKVPLEFSVSKFDVILALDVLEHLMYPETTVKRLSERLVPGGLFISSIPNVGNYSVSWPLFFSGNWDYADEGHLDRTHLRFFSKKSAEALFRNCGYSIISIIPTYKSPDLFSWLGCRSSTSRWYSRRFLQMLRFPSHWIESQYLIVARLT